MASGTKGEPGIHPQGHPPLGVGLLPVGNHQQPLADFHGLVERLPVVFPVRVLHAVHRHQQLAVLRVVFFQLRYGDPGRRRLAEALLVFLRVEGDPAFPGHGAVQLLVHIVPVLLILLQEAAEIGLVLDDKAVDSQGAEGGLHRLQASGGHINMEGKPFHSRGLLSDPRPCGPRPLFLLSSLKDVSFRRCAAAGLSSYFTFAPAGAGPSFRASEKKQRFCDGHIEWPRRIDCA